MKRIKTYPMSQKNLTKTYYDSIFRDKSIYASLRPLRRCYLHALACHDTAGTEFYGQACPAVDLCVCCDFGVYDIWSILLVCSVKLYPSIINSKTCYDSIFHGNVLFCSDFPFGQILCHRSLFF